MRLLAINFGGIGDEILFLPALKSIRDKHPDWHIGLLLEPRSCSINQVTTLIDTTITFNIKKQPLLMGDLLHLLAILRGGKFDIVVSSGSSPLVSLLLFASGIQTRVGYNTWPLARLLLTSTVPLNKQQYAAAMYHDLVKGLGIEHNVQLPQITISSASLASMKAFLRQSCLDITDNTVSLTQTSQHPLAGRQGLQQVLIHPGTSKLAVAKGIIKTWHPDCWAELIEKLIKLGNIEVILAGGPDDKETIEAIVSKLPKHLTSFILAYGHTKNLGDLAALIALCNLLVCVDSAPMHLAVGLRKPLVALFGPTNEKYLLPENALFRAIKGTHKTTPEARYSRTGFKRSNPSSSTHVQIQVDTVLEAVAAQLKVLSGQENVQQSR